VAVDPVWASADPEKEETFGKRRVHDHAGTYSAHVSEARDHRQGTAYGRYLKIIDWPLWPD
jgi:hypothetical protein